MTKMSLSCARGVDVVCLFQKLIMLYTVHQKIDDDTSGEVVDVWSVSKQKSHLAVCLQGNVLS